jgi:hypothetical protein
MLKQYSIYTVDCDTLYVKYYLAIKLQNVRYPFFINISFCMSCCY